MLFYLKAALVYIFLLVCLTSAFSTRFLIEEADTTENIPLAKETKTQQMEKNNTEKKMNDSQRLEVQVIPLAPEVLTLTENFLKNMTPLKLASAVAAEHLMTTVKNIPVASNSYKDTFDMLEGIVSEFNKSAQIIKLTAMYVNISGQYILATLKEYEHQNCDMKTIEQAMKSVRENFLKIIITQTELAIKELFQKSSQREVTSSDILVEASYHIVSAFQEMTKQVLLLAEESKTKCPAVSANPATLLQNGEKDIKGIFSFEPISQQGKNHKSIKKDQAQLKEEDKVPQIHLNNIEEHSDIKYKASEMSPKLGNAQSVEKKEEVSLFKSGEDLTVEYIPLKKMASNLNNRIPTESFNLNTINKIKNKFENSKEHLNNQDLTVEIFSPETFLNKNNQLKDDKIKVKSLKVPEYPTAKYIPQKEFSPFQASKKGDEQEGVNFLGSVVPIVKQYRDNTIEGGGTKNQDLGLEIAPPVITAAKKNNLLSDQKIATKQIKLPGNLMLEIISPNKISLLNSKTGILSEPSTQSKLTTSNGAGKVYDKELDSAAVDSLSNVPLPSHESDADDFNKGPIFKGVTGKSSPFVKSLNILQSKEVELQNNCGETLEPVCGYDNKSGKFIVFLNPCKQDLHNNLHQTNYSTVKMDSCVKLFLRNPSMWAHTSVNNPPHNNVDLRPR